MTRQTFDAKFAATEQSTGFEFDAAALKRINDTVFAQVSELDADDLATKSACDHAFEAAMASL